MLQRDPFKQTLNMLTGFRKQLWWPKRRQSPKTENGDMVQEKVEMSHSKAKRVASHEDWICMAERTIKMAAGTEGR